MNDKQNTDHSTTGVESWWKEAWRKHERGECRAVYDDQFDLIDSLLSQAKREGYIRALQDVRLDKFPTYERIDEEIKRFYNH